MNCEAMNSVGFTADERSTIWKIISAILHLVCKFNILMEQIIVQAGASAVTIAGA